MNEGAIVESNCRGLPIITDDHQLNTSVDRIHSFKIYAERLVCVRYSKSVHRTCNQAYFSFVDRFDCDLLREYRYILIRYNKRSCVCLVCSCLSRGNLVGSAHSIDIFHCVSFILNLQINRLNDFWLAF